MKKRILIILICSVLLPYLIITYHNFFNPKEISDDKTHEHSWNEWYPSDNDAYLERDCAYCDEIQTRSKTEADTAQTLSTECNHKYGKWKIIKRPTCDAEGNKVKTCEKCGQEYTYYTEAKGHKWSSWKITKPATYSKKGVKEKICSRCDKVKIKKYSLPVTLGMRNALKTAFSYLDSSSFSKSGLIKQLKFEGYSQNEAEYAVSRCGANWNEQAAKTAQSYLDSSSFSRSALIRQLEFEGFSYSQALYGVEAVGY